MINIAVIVACLIASTPVPYKPANEFTIKLDYTFKQRPTHDHITLKYDQPTASSPNGAILPYLVVNISIDSLNQGETRVKISNNKMGAASVKRARTGMVVSVHIGFTDDAKDGVTANEFTLLFLDAEKSEVNKIVIKIDEEGNFFVNEEKRGKF